MPKMTKSFLELLNGVDVILASGSPRRKAFLEELGIPFQVQTHEVDESYPPTLKGADIARYIVDQKLKPFEAKKSEKQLIIAADTVVWKAPYCLGKPKDAKEALSMLKQLSGATHEVITAVGILYQGRSHVFYESSKVVFKALSEEMIQHYIQIAQPFDKAGAYGIQEWIGWVGVERIEGSYTNIVGLPTAALIDHITRVLTLQED